MGFGRDPSGGGTGLSPKAGNSITRQNNAGGPLTVPNSTVTLITDALMDDESSFGAGGCGATWNSASDQFDITEMGIYCINTEVDFTTETAGLAFNQIYVNDSNSDATYTRYGSFANAFLIITNWATVWLDVGSFVRLQCRQLSGTSGSVDYAFMKIIRVG